MSESRTFDPAGVVFGLLVPVLAAVAVLVTGQLWSSRLPDTLATHFSGGIADGFASTSSTAWTFVLVIVLVGGGCSAVAALAQALLVMRRTMLIVGSSVTGLMLALWFGLMSAHLDLAAPADADMSTTPIAVGVLVGGAVGVLGASLLRDHRERRAADERPAAKLPRGPIDLPIVTNAGLGTGTTAVLLGIAAVVTVGVCRLAGSWWLLAVFLPVCVLVVGLLRFRVVLDESGLRVYNMGMCAIGYGVDELAGASVTEVAPFKDWGGWGLRVNGRGNYGVVTETGPALVFEAANGQRLTITTDRATEMAGALNALADASRPLHRA
ncbi:DUF1648 domain-containing protein [Rhodococcus gannanensis]|uniref:DUF1648 domain-containing protein n=1 Tax=Rhodococcus gannanensis TaxID=1960308 RepID=A0ABW4P1M1_9NOCA